MSEYYHLMFYTMIIRGYDSWKEEGVPQGVLYVAQPVQ